jgi:hypothetical protein
MSMVTKVDKSINDLEVFKFVEDKEGEVCVRFATSNKDSFFQEGITSGEVIKTGEGRVSKLIISSVIINSVVTLYDSISASGTVLWDSGAMPANAIPFGLEFGDLSFSTGLTIVISDANCNVLVVYE